MRINDLSQSSNRPPHRKIYLFSFLLLAGALCLAVLPAEATLSNFRLCFTQVVGLPITNPNQPPTIDGVISGDPGWTQAFRYVFGNGTPFSDVAVQGIKDNTFLYLSFEVNNDATYDDQDVIVLTLSPGTSAADDRRIHIYPNNNGVQKGIGSAAREVDYWTNSSTWNTPGQATSTLPAGVSIAVSNSGAPDSGNVSWFVEVKLPISDFSIPAGGNFGFYFDVIRVNGGTGTATEYYWPPVAGNSIGVFTDTNTPAPATWGNGTRAAGATCNGVSISYSDIVSNHSIDQIDATPGNSNIFTVTAHNNSVDSGGNPIAANQVTAKFSVANFGLPSNWTQVPVAVNPAGPQNIAASSTASLSTSPGWNITDPGLIANYKAHPDQCILVDLDSLAPNVTFVNKSVKRNMWVLTASEAARIAEIDASAYGNPPQGRTQHIFNLHVSTRSEVLKPGQRTFTAATTVPTGRVASRLTWVVGGCRLTGNFLGIKKNKYEICEDVGAFGGLVEHIGAAGVVNWQPSLTGAGLTKVEKAKDTYQLPVSRERPATVTGRFAPQEGPAGGGGNCFQSAKPGGNPLALGGLFLLGLIIYRPWKRKE